MTTNFGGPGDDGRAPDGLLPAVAPEWRGASMGMGWRVPGDWLVPQAAAVAQAVLPGFNTAYLPGQAAPQFLMAGTPENHAAAANCQRQLRALHGGVLGLVTVTFCPAPVTGLQDLAFLSSVKASGEAPA